MVSRWKEVVGIALLAFRNELCDQLLHEQFIVVDSVGFLLGQLVLKGISL